MATGRSWAQESRIVRMRSSGRGCSRTSKERGLAGVQLVVSDGHTGIQKAAEAAFLGASWQMCSAHCTPGGTEKYSPETPEGGCRGSEGGVWE
ncbi:transposase [Methanoculleus sp. 10]|uniref:transposase n=1 Tax=Methanoculleus sp. 10 TaxID=430615 RepID=UPI003427092B